MPALFTNKQRVLNALSLKQESNLYLAIGRTTPWDNEISPPTPLVTDLVVTELIYIKKIVVKHMIIDDDPYDAYGPDVEVGGYGYMFIDDINAYSSLALGVYLSTTIYYDDIAPIDTTFRQVGVLLNPLDISGNLLTGVEYLAASVISQGEVLYLDNREYITRDPSQSEKFEIILNF
jgi:hypothetical protein